MAEANTFFATVPKAMEPLLVEELTALGAQDVQAKRAGATFKGSLETAYRACLWSRLANRVLLPLKTFSAPTPEKLYGGVKSIRWSDHMGPENTFAIDFSSSQSKITHTHFGALKVKDAIVDQLRSTQGARPSVNTLQPDIRINVYVHKDEATVSLDLSGDSLHMRGYREQNTPAPLKENLAAAILMSARWGADGGEAFLDPMCGSGTLPIEAALMMTDRAPGLGRSHFGFLKWKGHAAATWKKILDEAQERAKAGLQIKHPKIVGYDQDFRAVRLAISNLERAGMRGIVHIEKRALSEAQPPAPKGILVLNPPYGERMGEEEALKPLYGEIGDVFKQRFKGWRGYVFTGSPLLSKSVGLKASRRTVLFNGAIECRLLQYDLY